MSHRKALLPGVYVIENLLNGKRYVGSSLNMAERFETHRKQLQAGIHANKHLQAAWRKHGESAFTFSTIEEASTADILKREQFWIDSLESSNPRFGYNKRLLAHSNMGITFGPDIRRKLSEARLGNKYALGFKHSPETIEKRRQSLTGQKRSRKHRPLTPGEQMRV